ncbi:MAG: NAD(P)(+) transhydrogenase (Re/Si-specific) subunit alpha, partial [Pseudomonadota bacterium]
MKIGAPKEVFDGEARVALTPESAGRLQKLGYDCLVESGAGAGAASSDAAEGAARGTVGGTAGGRGSAA